MEETTSVKNFNTLIWWLFKLCGFPIVVPWLLYYVYNAVKLKREKSLLHGKSVMITGASSGLGEAMAHTFYKCGCKVILVSRRKEELERVKQNLIQSFNIEPTHPPIILPLDLTDMKLMHSEVSKLMATHGTIDILINNAGISSRGEACSTKIDVDMKVMLINYFAQIGLAKVVIPSMIKQQSGHIVCISSVQGKIAIPHRSSYGASKHALQAWCDSCRAELSNKNIEITVVNPGYIRTSLSLNAVTENGKIHGVMDETTQGGYSPEYVSEEILKAILKKKKEVTIAQFTVRCAIFIRTLFPSLYFWIMKKRASKGEKND